MDEMARAYKRKCPICTTDAVPRPASVDYPDLLECPDCNTVFDLEGEVVHDSSRGH